MRVLLGHSALRGDCIINLPAISFLRDQFGWSVDMPIYRPLMDMVPLFFNQRSINSVFITDKHDGFPSELDKVLLSSRAYDRVYDPMQRHVIDRWFEKMHQTDAVLFDYVGLELPKEYRQIRLIKWFPHETSFSKHVAIAPFAGFTSNPDNDKRLSTARAQEIVDIVVAKGYKVLHLGVEAEPRLTNTDFFPFTFFEATQALLGCRALIHTDTSWGWVASAYQFPQLGLYGHKYYYKENVKSIQPVNPNSIYLDAPTVAEINMESITKAIDTLFS